MRRALVPANGLPLSGLTRGARVMIIAPHPADETLGAAGLLQRALAVGAAVRVLFVTDGENNPWPQRVLERRWRIGSGGRTRWGARRRAEALAALRVLGVQSGSVRFLGLPDRQLTALLLQGDTPERALAAHIHEWRPTMLVGPSPSDRHPDNSAVAVLLELALASLAPDDRREHLEYVIHGRAPDASLALQLHPLEQARKEAAIRCHASELVLHRRGRVLRSRSERFVVRGQPAPLDRHHPVRDARVNGSTLVVDLALGAGWPLGSTRLHVVGLGSPAGAVRRTVPLPLRGGWVPVRDGGTDRARALFVRGWRRATLGIPLGALLRSERLFVKVERRAVLFDGAGWKHVVLPGTTRAPPRFGRAGPRARGGPRDARVVHTSCARGRGRPDAQPMAASPPSRPHTG